MKPQTLLESQTLPEPQTQPRLGNPPPGSYDGITATAAPPPPPDEVRPMVHRSPGLEDPFVAFFTLVLAGGVGILFGDFAGMLGAFVFGEGWYWTIAIIVGLIPVGMWVREFLDS